MDVPLHILEKVPELADLGIEYDLRDPKIGNLLSAFRENFNFTGRVDTDFINFLCDQNINVVSVMSNPRLLAYLRKTNPIHYLTPNLTLTLSDLIKKTDEYFQMNAHSQKKRRLTVLQDVYYFDARTEKKMKLLPYNSTIGEKVLSQMSKYSDFPEAIQVLDSETGALVFIPDVKDFKLKVDLFAILSQFDFPILDSNDVKQALSLYLQKQPKLVIIANLDSDPLSKQLLLELEEIDPFVKKLNYTLSPASNRMTEQARIEHYYSYGYKEIIENAKSADLKENLPEQIKKTILISIKELETNFTVQSYYEKAYALKQFGRLFNIKMLWNMMVNLKKRFIR
jgi:hypothetical protein